MPKINEPFTVVTPPAGTDGREINTPLLSKENMVTGFGTCWARVTYVGLQPDAGQS